MVVVVVALVFLFKSFFEAEMVVAVARGEVEESWNDASLVFGSEGEDLGGIEIPGGGGSGDGDDGGGFAEFVPC